MIFENFSFLIFALIFFLVLIGFFGGWYMFFFSSSQLKISHLKSQLFVFITFLGAVFFMLFSLLEPKIIFLNSVENTQGKYVSFLLDVSKSMNVEDVEGYENIISRISGAKQLISNYITRHPHNFYSLSIFSGESQRILPFTSDNDLFLTLLDGVSYKNISTGGTHLNAAIEDGVSNFSEEQKGGVLVLISDGGDEKEYKKNPDIWEKLTHNQIAFLVIGIGSSQGGLIPLGRDVFGSMRYQIYNGKEVISKRNDTFLKKVSSLYGGEYFSFSGVGEYSYIESNLEELGLKQYFKISGKGQSLTYLSICLSFILFCASLFGYYFPLGKKIHI